MQSPLDDMNVKRWGMIVLHAGGIVHARWHGIWHGSCAIAMPQRPSINTITRRTRYVVQGELYVSIEHGRLQVSHHFSRCGLLIETTFVVGDAHGDNSIVKNICDK